MSNIIAIDFIMVSAPPPIVMGGPENFQPNYHGGSFPVPPLNGGTWPLGGTITYNGGTFDILSQIILHITEILYHRYIL